MSHTTLSIFSLVALISVSACTTIPKSDVPQAKFLELNCAELQHEATLASETKTAASAARGNAWHIILPVMVAARYINAVSAESGADKRTAELSNELAKKDCKISMN